MRLFAGLAVTAAPAQAALRCMALPNGINGGMAIYYTRQDFASNGNQKMTAFRPGSRMTVGNPATSSRSAAEGHVGLRFACLDERATRFPELPTFPSRPCVGGIMTVHHFPSCLGRSSHPVHMPKVAYATLWDITGFNHLCPADGSNPFFSSWRV